MQVTLTSGVVANFPSLKPTEGIIYDKGAVRPPEVENWESLVGISADKQFFMKVEFKKSDRKNFDLHGEAAIIRHLNERNCRTCTKLWLIRDYAGEELTEKLAGQVDDRIVFESGKSYAVMVTEAIESMTPIYTPDLTMAIIEQKKLGVWNGDITPQDVRMDPKTKCIKLIDYDQAEMLDDQKMNMPTLDFIKWIDDLAVKRWGKYEMTGFLFNMKTEWDTHFGHFFDGDSFNLAATHLFQSQETTLNTGKIYHSFRTDDVYAQGERTLDDRKQFLDRIEFEDGERVLDVGCNAGLLCHYLDDRGCDVWGIDIDPSVIEGAQILANITGRPDINFQCHDVDNGGPIGYFDTILLFSVIHHTANIHENAERIAKLCDRIIIECRLRESGAKPIDGQWIQTTVWEHDNLESLTAGLEVLFPKFKFARVLGQGDRDRYVMEFIKPSN